MNIEAATAERLASYYAFSPDVIDTVAEHAGFQASFETYQEYLQQVGAELPAYGRGRPVLDIQPEDYDPSEALVVNLPMGNALDPNQQFQIATVAGTNPDRRVIAFANPAGRHYGVNKVPFSGLVSAWTGSFDSAIERKERYLDHEGIIKVDETGASYGADILAATAASGRYQIDKAVAIEPASAVKRMLLPGLLPAFASSEAPLEGYVKANSLPIFEAARDDSTDAASILGLLRLSNAVSSHGISRGRFEEHLTVAQQRRPETEFHVVWGSESELVMDGLMIGIVIRRGANGIRLEGQKHALMNDVHLNAAIALECLRASDRQN
jgi:hypothetical protein